MDPIGKRLRERRDELGLTVRQVAERCQVDASTISRLETGKMPNGSFEIVAKVARKGLGLSLDALDELREVPVKEAIAV